MIRRLLDRLFGRRHAHAVWDGRGFIHRHVVIGDHPIEVAAAHKEVPR